MKQIGNILWGIVLIVIGLIIGGNALEIIDVNIFFAGWWTLFIIIPCFIGLFKENEKTGNVIGLVIGIALLLGCQEVIAFDLIWKLAFPTILIIIGLSIVFKDTFSRKVTTEINKLNKKNNNESSYCATFSSKKEKINNEQFNGADLTAVFGAVELDLRNAIIDKDVVINASGIFGGIEIYVPSNVKVIAKSTSIFGGVDNKANTNKNDANHTIYLNATALFGGIEIK